MPQRKEEGIPSEGVPKEAEIIPLVRDQWATLSPKDRALWILMVALTLFFLFVLSWGSLSGPPPPGGHVGNLTGIILSFGGI